MKKYFTIIAALFAIAAVSCQKETALLENNKADEIETVEPAGEVTVFSANLPAAPDSKSILGAKDVNVYHPLWTATDSIIVNGVLSAEAQLENGGLSAKFAVGGVSSPYMVLTPSNKRRDTYFNYDEANRQYDYVFPGAGKPQSYTVDGEGNPTYDHRVGLLAAYSDNESLAFKHLNVYFRITTTAGTDDDNIRYIYIRNGDESSIEAGMNAGTWTATYTDADHITVAPKSVTSVIALDCGEGGVPQGTPMVIGLPAYDYPDGLIVTIKDINGHFISFKIKSSATQFSASAGTIYEFSREFSPVAGTINTAEDWEAFAAAVNSNKDFNLYRWVGNGTVKIGADINTTNLTKLTPKKFPYNVDGQDHTITRTDATGSLFRGIRGTVSNLSVDGTLVSTTTITAALADSLYQGGRIEYCNNGASITQNPATYGIGGGLVGIMTGGTISHCNNTGSLTVNVTCSSQSLNLQAAGIVGQINNSVAGKPCGNATIEYCTNSGAITADPTCNDAALGINYAAVGGIVAWLRGTSHSFTIDHCENTATGAITYKGDHVSGAGMKYNAVFAGGIAGIASDMNNGYLKYATGLDVSISNCTNLGQVHNCGINVSTGVQNLRHIYTGGIAGSCVGTTSKHASITSCKNKGTLLTYDLTGDGTYAYPEYCQVVGGIVGFGGFLDVDGCTVNCTIGNGKRACNSIGGVIGHAIRTFSVSNCTIWFTFYFTRINKVNHINNATVAVTPMKYDTSSNSTQIVLDGSTVSDIKAKGNGNYYNTTTGSTADDSSKCTNEFTIGASTANMVRGFPTSSNTEQAKVAFSGTNETLDAEPVD